MTALPSTRPGTRIAWTLTATVSGVVLLLALKPHTAATVAGPSAPAANGPTAAPGSSASGGAGSASGGGSSASGGAGSASGGGSSASGGAGSASGGATRTIDGDTVQTRYGPVQVRVTLTGGKLTAVSVIQAPDGNGRDAEITGFAVPQLTQEALAAQNAQIDSVSGATYTSEGYTRSLQSALDKADG